MIHKSVCDREQVRIRLLQKEKSERQKWLVDGGPELAGGQLCSHDELVMTNNCSELEKSYLLRCFFK